MEFVEILDLCSIAVYYFSKSFTSGQFINCRHVIIACPSQERVGPHFILDNFLLFYEMEISGNYLLHCPFLT